MIGLEKGMVRLTPYNPAWKALYEIEKRRILEAAGKMILDIQHVGSTALPGGAAKPIIDIAIAVESYEKAFASVEPIVELGYEYRGENGIPRRHFFVKRDPRSTHHIHMNELHSQDWENQILFRDYLLAHPELVQEYTRLKLRLADQFPSDRLAYVEGKSPFIEHILQLARAELSSDQEEASEQNGEK